MPHPIEADSRFPAFMARDPAADGRFIVAVTSTRIFCRPTCPARRPLARNIAFYDTAAQAEAAGFRACLRCRPLALDGRDPAAERCHAIAAYIRAHATEPLTLADLAARAGISPFHLQRGFKAVIGVSPRDYQAAHRLDLLKTGLRAGEPVLAATFDAGYGSTSRVYAQVGAIGMTPSAYRAGGAGETIAWAVRETTLGPLLMAATDRGVCRVRFGDDAATLEADLAAEYPRAALVAARPGAALDGWLAALEAHLAAAGPAPNPPLDLHGTAFQLKVWRFLTRITPGRPISYTELAAGIGAPKAVRAAASACAANRVALLVPCHRVLRGDGGLGGYRWGTDRKRALIEAERAAAGLNAPADLLHKVA